jgi:hypothetical protein
MVSPPPNGRLRPARPTGATNSGGDAMWANDGTAGEPE